MGNLKRRSCRIDPALAQSTQQGQPRFEIFLHGTFEVI